MPKSGFDETLPPEKGGSLNSGILYSPRCKICTSAEQFLSQVNRLLMMGVGYSEISKQMMPVARAIGISINPHMVANHYKNHFDFQSDAIRQIIRTRNAARIEQYGEAVEMVIDARTAVEIVMQKGLTQLANPEAPVTVKETLEAAKLVDALSRDDEARIELSEAKKQLALIIKAVQAVVTKDQIEDILAIVNGEKQLEIEQAKEPEYLEVIGSD